MTEGDRIGRDLDTLLDAADAEASAASGNRGLPPFTAVMARASRIDPGNLSNRRVSTRSSEMRAPSRDPDAILDDLVVAARAEAVASVAAREDHAPPPWVDQRRTTVSLRAAVGGVLVAVAAAAVVVTVLGGDGIGRAAHESDEGSLAAAQATVPGAQGHASAAAHRKTTAAPVPSPNATDPTPLPEPQPTNEGTEQRVASENPTLLPQPPNPKPAHERHDAADAPRRPAQIKRRPSRRKTVPRPTIEELDALAREALAVGDLAGADTALAALIDRNSRGRLEEAAFGDRFAIAHRLRDTAAQRRLWRVYLERFPSGRFAEEARAGLCRHNPAEGTTCWQRYLDDYPSGTYRAQARRALADSPPAPTPTTEDQP